MSTTTSFLNTIAASGADITLVSRKLGVAITSSTGSGLFPVLSYPNISNVTISPAITETLYVTRIGWTAASSTVFGFTINQMVNGQMLSKSSFYESDTSGTDTEIGTALAAGFSNSALGVTVSYTPANAYVTVTAVTGTPTFQVTLAATGTMTNTHQMAGVAITACTSMATVASCTAANPTVITTSAAHGLSVGQQVVISASADGTKLANGTYKVATVPLGTTLTLVSLDGSTPLGATATTTATLASPSFATVITAVAHGLVNGKKITITSADDTKLASGTYIVQYLSANTYSLYDVYGNPIGASATTTATLVGVAGSAVGSGTDLAAAGETGASAGVGYAKYYFAYNVPTTGVPGSSALNTGLSTTLYVKQWATTTTATYTSNFQAFATKMNQVVSNMGVGTVAVPVPLASTLAISQVVPAV
jgi:hypothetical protein